MDERDVLAIELVFTKYHRVLQNLFDAYSGVAYNGQGSGLID
jgi:hypothetical protein